MNQSRARRAPSRAGMTRPRPATKRAAPPKKERFKMFCPNPGPVSLGFAATLLVLIGFGLIVLYSASYATSFYRFHDSFRVIRPQVMFAVLGGIGMWIVSRMDYHWLRQFAWPLYGCVLLLLIVVLFMPPIKGCRRWINLEGLPTIQVSEIGKFAVILLMAHLFAQNPKQTKSLAYGIIRPAALILPILVLLYLEPHNSAMVLVCCITGALMFAGGTRVMYLLLIGGAGAAGIAGIIMMRPGYVQERLSGWLDPFSDMLDSTMQTGQSLYTIGSGGMLGVGIGNSVQKHGWLPEPANDFIFSVLCEELGFVGGVTCIVLFTMLIVQGIIIAINAPDRFGFLLVIGCIAQVGFQFLFNVAVVTNLLPNTGISLPFFSSGGTSLLLLMCQMGVVFSVSRAGNKKRIEQQEQETQKLREKMKTSDKISDFDSDFIE